MIEKWSFLRYLFGAHSSTVITLVLFTRTKISKLFLFMFGKEPTTDNFFSVETSCCSSSTKISLGGLVCSTKYVAFCPKLILLKSSNFLNSFFNRQTLNNSIIAGSGGRWSQTQYCSFMSRASHHCDPQHLNVILSHWIVNSKMWFKKKIPSINRIRTLDLWAHTHFFNSQPYPTGEWLTNRPVKYSFEQID